MNNKKYYVLFLISLLSVWAELALSGCFRATDQSAQRERDSIAKLLEAYIDGYKSGDYGKVRFAADVTLEGPLTSGKILGKPAVQKFLSKVHAKDVRVKRQIIDGQFACVLADFETTEGTVVPFCEFFRVRGSEIAEIRPYFDPRPFVR
jgi:SnoaL-like domain